MFSISEQELVNELKNIWVYLFLGFHWQVHTCLSAWPGKDLSTMSIKCPLLVQFLIHSLAKVVLLLQSYTTWPKVCANMGLTITPTCWISFLMLVPFAVKIAFTLLRRLFTRFWSGAVWICAQSGKNALVRSGSDVKWGGLFITKVLSGVELRALCRSPLAFIHSTFGITCHYGPCFVHRCVVMLSWRKIVLL